MFVSSINHLSNRYRRRKLVIARIDTLLKGLSFFTITHHICYFDDSTKPLSSNRQKRLTGWRYVMPERFNLDSYDSDNSDYKYDYDDDVEPRQYELYFGNLNEYAATAAEDTDTAEDTAETNVASSNSNDDRSFLHDLLGSMAPTFHFNMARVIVRSSYSSDECTS